MRSWQQRQAGDTIIEVILAVTIFSLVAVGAMTIMSNGTAMAQRSVEITQSRQQIDTQAELLRFLHDRAREDPSSSYGSIWQSIVSGSSSRIVGNPYQFVGDSECLANPGSFDSRRMFVLAPSADATQPIRLVTQYRHPATFAKLDTSGDPTSEGLSIQLVRVSGGNAYDAHIQACWDSPGSSQPATIGTIVRIYDPEA